MFGDYLVSVGEAITIARLLTELAQINLACLESRITKHHPKRQFELLELDDMWHTMQYVGKTEELIDDEDYGRVGYFVRKYKARLVSSLSLRTALSRSFSEHGALRTIGTMRIDLTLTSSGTYCWISGDLPLQISSTRS